MVLNKHLFFLEHPKGCFVFLPEHHNVIALDKDSFLNLKKGDLSSFSDEDLAVLKSQEIIDPKPFVQEKINLGLKLTSGCNFNCEFCSQKGIVTKNSNMSFDIAKKAIDTFFLNSSKFYEIGFFGGEPLLKPQIIRDVITYVADNHADKNVFYHINTNGFFLVDNVELLDRSDLHTSISIEGPIDYYKNKEHYILRIKEAIKKFKHKDNILINTVLVDENVDILDALMDEYTELGINNYAICIPSFNLDSFWSAPETMPGRIIHLFDHAKKIGVHLMFSNWGFWKRKSANCSSLSGNDMFIDMDGKSTVCHSIPLVIGDVSNKTSSLFLEEFPAYIKQELETCKNCEIFAFCKGGCFADEHLVRGPENIFCSFAKEFFKEYAEFLIKHGE